MSILKNSLTMIKRRPAAVVIIGLIILALSILDNYNPLYGIIYGITLVSGGSIFENVIYILQFILKPEVVIKALAAGSALILAFSLAAGLVLSGYFYVLNKDVNSEKKSKGEFMQGIRKYFMRVWLMSLAGMFTFILLLIFALVAMIPGLIITRGWIEGKGSILLPMVFIDAVTVYALFFIFLFFRIYLFYWYPAAFNFDEKPFKAAKRAADSNFWPVTSRFILFDIIFIAFELIYITIRIMTRESDNTVYQVLLILFNWMFNMAFFSTFTRYIFSSLKGIIRKNQI